MSGRGDGDCLMPDIDSGGTEVGGLGAVLRVPLPSALYVEVALKAHRS
jgi:hypothetical protein